jgi:hypothetical protein
MYYYLIMRIGDGSTADPYRPDLDGVSWAGVDLGDRYLVATSEPIDGLTPLTDEAVRATGFDAALSWKVA